RQLNELVDYTQKLVHTSESRREQYWAKADKTSPERWDQTTQPYRDRIWDDMIGRLPPPNVPMSPRTRKSYSGEKWDGYEVTLDLWADVVGYGVLLVPKGLKAEERRPVVVCQHGLQGTPQMLFGQNPVDRVKNTFTDYHYYQNMGSRLADLGFIVYMPQNPY